MTKKNKLNLVLSTIVFILTFVAIFQQFETIHFIGFETKIIWIPIWIAIVVLPLLNLYEITVNTEERNGFYWLSLLINIITILFMIRYFKLELLP
jgi:hypothetical protein